MNPFDPEAQKSFADVVKKTNSMLTTSDVVAKKKTSVPFRPLSSKSTSSNSTSLLTQQTTSSTSLSQTTSSSSNNQSLESSASITNINSSTTIPLAQPVHTTQPSLPSTPQKKASLSITNSKEQQKKNVKDSDSSIFTSVPNPSVSQKDNQANDNAKEKQPKKTKKEIDQEIIQKGSYSIEDWKKEKKELEIFTQQYRECVSEKTKVEKEIGNWMKQTDKDCLLYGDKVIKVCKRTKVPRIKYTDVCKMVLDKFGKEELDKVLTEVDRLITQNTKQKDFLLIKKLKQKPAKKKSEQIDLGETESIEES